MAINVFEGGRRVLKLFVGIWILGALAAAYFFEPSLSQTYVVSTPGATPTASQEEGCEWDDLRETEYLKSPSGKSVSIILCFKAAKTDDGTSFIPTERENGLLQGWDKYSNEAKKYSSAVAKQFAPPVKDLKAIDDRYWLERLTQMKPGATVAIVGVSVLYGFAVVLGWILRGFMGIPRGADKRPEAKKAASE